MENARKQEGLVLGQRNMSTPINCNPAVEAHPYYGDALAKQNSVVC